MLGGFLDGEDGGSRPRGPGRRKCARLEMCGRCRDCEEIRYSDGDGSGWNVRLSPCPCVHSERLSAGGWRKGQGIHDAPGNKAIQNPCDRCTQVRSEEHTSE